MNELNPEMTVMTAEMLANTRRVIGIVINVPHFKFIGTEQAKAAGCELIEVEITLYGVTKQTTFKALEEWFQNLPGNSL